MIKRYYIICQIIFLVFIFSCTSNPIDLVKSGTINKDKSTTVGNAFENYSFISNKDWRQFEDAQKRNIVEFRGKIDINQYKSMKYGSIQMTPLIFAEANKNIAELIYVAKFAISKDGKSFEVLYSGCEICSKKTKRTNCDDETLSDIENIYKNILLKSAFFAIYETGFQIYDRIENAIGIAENIRSILTENRSNMEYGLYPLTLQITGWSELIDLGSKIGYKLNPDPTDVQIRLLNYEGCIIASETERSSTYKMILEVIDVPEELEGKILLLQENEPIKKYKYSDLSSLNCVVTKHGILAIDNLMDESSPPYLIKLNNIPLYLGHEYFSVHMERLFQVDNEEIVLLGCCSGGTACPMLYRILQIKSEKLAFISEEFGNCSDSPQIKQEQGKIILSFKEPRLEPDKIAVCEDGRLTYDSSKVSFKQLNTTNKAMEMVKFIGRHPYDLLQHADLTATLKALTKSYYTKFLENIEVAPFIRIEGEYYFGEGIAPHLGGEEEAAFCIDTNSLKISGAILTNGDTIACLGAASKEDLPYPLYNWITRNRSNEVKRIFFVN